MKLISVKILGSNFRSLAGNKLYKFAASPRKSRLSPKVFAGLNGSGKSNFLELLAEIFFYLEKCHLRSVQEIEKKGTDIGFEIEYLLPATKLDLFHLFTSHLTEKRDEFVSANRPLTKLSSEQFEDLYLDEIEESTIKDWNSLIEELLEDDHVRVRVIKERDIQAKFYLKRKNEESYREISKRTESLLPKKIIAYTSGQNELLSNPFFKIRYHYFKESEKLNSVVNGAFKNDRLFFLDNSSNFSIFISNMLLASPEKLKYLKDIFKIDDLNSFRITINLVDYKKSRIQLTDEVISIIRKLILCSTAWSQQKRGKDEFIIIDYKVNSATHESFKFHFGSSFELFRVFYELDNLNLHLVPTDTRGLILKAHKSLNISDELPKADPSRLFFRIEKINLNKLVEEGRPSKNIYYKGLSDGEHQFNEVIGSVLMMEQDGCLFLMDEPDTHFNPVWRAKMIEMFNYVSASSMDAKGKPETVRQQEIIITTHSPFVISDSLREDVYKFDKVNGEVLYVNPKVETYGASVSLLLQEIFDRRITISDLSNFDLDELREALRQLASPEQKKAKIDEIKAKLLSFGESIEKFDLYSLLRQIEKELGNNQ
jgi:restriction system-associated AAA family ATPase